MEPSLHCADIDTLPAVNPDNQKKVSEDLDRLFRSGGLFRLSTEELEALGAAAEEAVRFGRITSTTQAGVDLLSHVNRICGRRYRFTVGGRFDDRKLIHRFKFRSILSLMITFQQDRKNRSDVAAEAKAELTAYRIYKGDASRYDQIINILWKDYKTWLRYFKKDYFFAFRDDYHISVRSSSKEKPHKFCVTEVCGLRLLTFHPLLEISISDKERNRLVTMRGAIVASSEWATHFKDVRHQYELELSKITLKVDSSDHRLPMLFERVLHSLDHWEQTTCRLKRDANEHIMRNFIFTNSCDVPCFHSPQPQRKGKKVDSFQTLKLRNKVRKGSWDLAGMERSPSFMNMLSLKSPRSRSPRKLTKTPNDLASDIHDLAAPLIGKWRDGDDMLKLFDCHLSEYDEYKKSPKYNSILKTELNKMTDFVRIAKSVYDFRTRFQFHDSDDLKLLRMTQMPTTDLLDTPEFCSKLVAPASRRRLLGPDNLLISEEEKPFEVLKAIFASIYQAGYRDRVVTNKSSKKVSLWMAELQAHRFLDKKDDPIQIFLVPMLESSTRLYELYQDLFPDLQHSKTSWNRRDDAANPVICSKREKSEPKLRIEGEKLQRIHTVHLYCMPLKDKIADLALCETFSFKEREACLRSLTIDRIDFVKGTSMDLVKNAIETMAKSAKERGCLG